QRVSADGVQRIIQKMRADLILQRQIFGLFHGDFCHLFFVQQHFEFGQRDIQLIGRLIGKGENFVKEDSFVEVFQNSFHFSIRDDEVMVEKNEKDTETNCQDQSENLDRSLEALFP